MRFPRIPTGAGLLFAALSCACLADVRGQGAARTWPSWLRPCTITGTTEAALCGVVDVPESADHAAGRTIGVHVTVVPARAAIAEADPVLLLAGGPGQGAADLARQLSARVGQIRDRFDLLLIDQRGTGQSNGLHCEAPVAVADLMGRIFDPARLAACRDQLSRRADLTRYTTAASAADYDIILTALGVPRVHVWGVSYGTRLGYEIARRFPERVRTLTLEGVVPITFTWPSTGAADLDAALNAVVADCMADAVCSGLYPDLRRDVDAAFARLQSRPIAVNVIDPTTGAPARVEFSQMDLALRGARCPVWRRPPPAGAVQGRGPGELRRVRAGVCDARAVARSTDRRRRVIRRLLCRGSAVCGLGHGATGRSRHTHWHVSPGSVPARVRGLAQGNAFHTVSGTRPGSTCRR